MDGRTGDHQRRFARHFGVMLLLMFAGMAVLAGLVELMLLPFNTSMNDASAPVMASVMAVTMTVPMVAWMPVARSIEMTASMVIPSAVAIALYAVAAISSESVLVIQHAVMIPAMLGVMLWRYDDYAH